jgi:hypothetical protein
MDFRLAADDRDLQRRARAFCDEELVPLEDECEEHGGLTPESHAAAKQAVLEWGFHGINHSSADGGQVGARLPTPGPDERDRREQAANGSWRDP